MPAGNAVDFKWYRYVSDNGENIAVKVDKTWGDDGDAGLAAYDAADPAITPGPAFRPRAIVLQDTASGRVTRRIVGNTAAAAWTTPGFTQTVPIRGAGGVLTLTKIANVGERLRRPRTITSLPEPATP